jgi:hypothetical protein
MPRAALVVLALVAAVAAAGCLASGGPSDAASADAGSSDAPNQAGGAEADDGPGGSSGNGTGSSGNATDTTWRNQTRRGTFTGANVVFGVFGRSETFNVPDDAVNLTIEIRSKQVELTGNIDPPCDDGSERCSSKSYTTASNRYVHRVTDPPAGDWDVSMFRDTSGAGQQEYTVRIARQLAPTS